MNQISIPASKVAELLAISERHVRKLNSEGRIPRPINLGRCVRWNVAELHRWQAAGAPNRELWEDMQSSDLNQSLNDRRDARYP
ncbi:MAG: helix-turn-helix domain-containing protein [Phycisphaerae bacterium]|nr:helix-turn-helix domain-containing protein [Phycisphaerae bacterium]